MELKDVKVGQRVFIKRESTAKLDDIENFGMELVKAFNKALDIDVVEECKKRNGFYVIEIKSSGNVCLGKKDENGELQYGWGTYDASDFELADVEKKQTSNDILCSVLREILSAIDELKQICTQTMQPQKQPKQEKRGRGRPKGSPNKKYK